jgi:hypothetical protein
MKFAIAAIAAASLAAPAAAGAAASDELKAADAVQRKLDRRYPAFEHMVMCTRTGARSFSCRFTAFDDDMRFVDGRASARKRGRGFRVTIRTRRVH